MAKKYNNNWNAKKLTINFNQKQWRQDFAAFVKEKMFWNIAKVTRSKATSNNPLQRGIKIFEVYNSYGGSVKVEYKEGNQIVNATDIELTYEYLKERGINV